MTAARGAARVIFKEDFRQHQSIYRLNQNRAITLCSHKCAMHDVDFPFISEELVKHRFLDHGQRTSAVPVVRRSPRASPSSSPSHPTSRSPNSISSNKLASMQRMRRNTTPPRPAVEIPIRTPHAGIHRIYFSNFP